MPLLQWFTRVFFFLHNIARITGSYLSMPFVSFHEMQVRVPRVPATGIQTLSRSFDASIHRAYCHHIRRAQNHLYFENQYWIGGSQDWQTPTNGTRFILFFIIARRNRLFTWTELLAVLGDIEETSTNCATLLRRPEPRPIGGLRQD
jgi:hypothetical protein